MSCPYLPTFVAFLDSVGIRVRRAVLDHPTFLPGIEVRNGEQVVDEARLLYPGYLLHEAGHVALLKPTDRCCAGPELGGDGGFEMGAVAWSYAAAAHLQIPPEVVFHEAGYRGSSPALFQNFANRRYVGVPILEWLGMAADTKRAESLGVERYPVMLRWLREEDDREEQV